MTTTTLDRATRVLARTYATRLDEVKRDFVGRDEAVDLVGLAALCGEHVLLLGPPGTAKSSLLDRFRRMLKAQYFSYLLTRFTEPAELFGPVDLRLLREKGVYRVNTTGMLPKAEVAFLDEVFQGSSAILNTLLTLVNERTYHNGAEAEPVPLVTLLGSSNEMPDDPLLAAFSDRFLLRCTLGYVPDDDIEDVLGLGWTREKWLTGKEALTDSGNGALPAGAATFPVTDLIRLRRVLGEVDLAPIRPAYGRIVRALRAEGVTFSDRRAVKGQKAFAATALLAGRREAELSDLAPLVHLWASPRDEPTIRRVAADHDVPLDRLGHVTRDPAELRLELRKQVAERERITTVEEFRDLLRRGRALAVELRRDHPQQGALIEDVRREQREMVTAYRELLGAEAERSVDV
ncbi:AAA family ATPase [Cryptosporangium phraense]|uniref:ATPase n=1 Tax=Cryptosporangium phraense TaxID=2593070 RepID=A0A545AZM5_9ACTN|nr:AAA family ATPase [Cryptosporangium phraense]TQS46758.1 ATPase [Cryptosporangium phraense]